MNEWKVVPIPNNPRPLVIHAPSHRGIKGTDIILQAVAQLKKEGVDFDFQLVEGLANKDAREVYERADLLIDQLYAGWYGGLSVELMALGKPVMCYIREGDLKFIPEEMRMELPIIMITPDALQSILFAWLTEKKQDLPSLGIQSRSFVEKWHDPLKIASRLREDYQHSLESKQ
jgi:glycosyltransferase involved in cell wall biosynthesis